MVTKKTVASKPTAKAAPAKTTEAKTTVETKPAEAVKKEEVKKAVKKEAPAKKPVAKKPAAPKKTAAKKTVKKQQDVYIQFGGREVLAADVLESVKKAWVAMGNKVGDMNDVQVYVKLEESQAYFVINGDVSGSVDL